MADSNLMADRALSPDYAGMLADLRVAEAVRERWPDYRALVIVAEGLDPARFDLAADPDPLARAETWVREQGEADWPAHPHIAAWMAAYSAFGAKPKRTSPSVLALIKRAGGGLPRIDPVTDLYNAVSVRHVLPVGGENLAAYVSAPRLEVAAGGEPFDTMESGAPAMDAALPGEVIWQDDAGVTCRRWNWRQCVRTRIGPETTTAFFLLEALGAMSDSELQAAGNELQAGLRRLAPGVALAERLAP
ncbi:MAG: phenylalanine--tRNA ligase beta subunit-related protein [Thermomicrobiales bacterium]